MKKVNSKLDNCNRFLGVLESEFPHIKPNVLSDILNRVIFLTPKNVELRLFSTAMTEEVVLEACRAICNNPIVLHNTIKHVEAQEQKKLKQEL